MTKNTFNKDGQTEQSAAVIIATGVGASAGLSNRLCRSVYLSGPKTLTDFSNQLAEAGYSPADVLAGISELVDNDYLIPVEDKFDLSPDLWNLVCAVKPVVETDKQETMEDTSDVDKQSKGDVHELSLGRRTLSAPHIPVSYSRNQMFKRWAETYRVRPDHRFDALLQVPSDVSGVQGVPDISVTAKGWAQLGKELLFPNRNPKLDAMRTDVNMLLAIRAADSSTPTGDYPSDILRLVQHGAKEGVTLDEVKNKLIPLGAVNEMIDDTVTHLKSEGIIDELEGCFDGQTRMVISPTFKLLMKEEARHREEKRVVGDNINDRFEDAGESRVQGVTETHAGHFTRLASKSTHPKDTFQFDPNVMEVKTTVFGVSIPTQDVSKLYKMAHELLDFAEKNPGATPIVQFLGVELDVKKAQAFIHHAIRYGMMD